MNSNVFGNKTIVFPDKPFALIFDLFPSLQNNLNWNSCMHIFTFILYTFGLSGEFLYIGRLFALCIAKLTACSLSTWHVEMCIIPMVLSTLSIGFNIDKTCLHILHIGCNANLFAD